MADEAIWRMMKHLATVLQATEDRVAELERQLKELKAKVGRMNEAEHGE